jgi:hypothetical protein
VGSRAPGEVACLSDVCDNLGRVPLLRRQEGVTHLSTALNFAVSHSFSQAGVKMMVFPLLYHPFPPVFRASGTR